MTPTADMIERANKRHDPKAWLWLFEIELNTDTTESRWVELTMHDEPVVLAGTTFHPFPLEFPDIENTVGGDLPAMRLRLSNIGLVGSDLLEQYSGLEGRRVLIRLAHEDLLADVADTLTAAYEVGDASVKGDHVELELGQLSLHDRNFPGERMSRYACRYTWLSSRCNEKSGIVTPCDFTLDGPFGCAVRDNIPRFGGAPGMPGALG